MSAEILAMFDGHDTKPFVLHPRTLHEFLCFGACSSLVCDGCITPMLGSRARNRGGGGGQGYCIILGEARLVSQNKTVFL